MKEMKPKQLRVYKIQLSVKSYAPPEEVQELIEWYMNDNKSTLTNFQLQEINLPERQR